MLRVSGSDSRSWLNGILTCDVTGVTERRGVWGLLLSRQGKIQTDVDLLADGDDALLLGVAAEALDSSLAQFDRLLVMEEAELESVADEWSWMTVHGRGVTELVAGAGLPQGCRWGVFSGGLGTVAVGIATPRGSEDAVVRELCAIEPRLETGSEHAAWQRQRVVEGLPLFGVDYGTEDNPHDASLERRAVCWTKGCYLGQEVVCMQDMRGKPKRRLVSLEVEGAGSLEAGHAVTAPRGEPVGRITTVVDLPAEARALALASVAAAHAAAGTVLEVAGRAAVVLDAPALDRDREEAK